MGFPERVDCWSEESFCFCGFSLEDETASKGENSTKKGYLEAFYRLTWSLLGVLGVLVVQLSRFSRTCRPRWTRRPQSCGSLSNSWICSWSGYRRRWICASMRCCPWNKPLVTLVVSGNRWGWLRFEEVEVGWDMIHDGIWCFCLFFLIELIVWGFSLIFLGEMIFLVRDRK